MHAQKKPRRRRPAWYSIVIIIGTSMAAGGGVGTLHSTLQLLSLQGPNCDRAPSESSDGRRRILSCLTSRITSSNPLGQPHIAAGSDIVNPTAAGAAAVELTRCQDQTGRHFCIRDAAATKLRNSKARPAAMVSGNFQPDLSTLKNGPKSGSAHGASTTGITHETKPKSEITQNGLVSSPSGTLKAGSSSQDVPQGTKAVLQPQAAEITEIVLKMGTDRPERYRRQKAKSLPSL